MPRDLLLNAFGLGLFVLLQREQQTIQTLRAPCDGGHRGQLRGQVCAVNRVSVYD